MVSRRIVRENLINWAPPCISREPNLSLLAIPSNDKMCLLNSPLKLLFNSDISNNDWCLRWAGNKKIENFYQFFPSQFIGKLVTFNTYRTYNRNRIHLKHAFYEVPMSYKSFEKSTHHNSKRQLLWVKMLNIMNNIYFSKSQLHVN